MKVTQFSVTKIRTPTKTDFPHKLMPNSCPMDTLIRSVREKGLLTPIFVTNLGEIVGGHYRFLAALSCGMVRVPAVVVKSMEEAVAFFV